ncbi:MAG: hypothetical protein B7Z74_01865 [Deltaproteobacteria bacterium 21-66-5]|nr:MAG: hypothetical protein B7Z74_01865 [Deltaproteobacteria bacterium 21-66-5]
MSRLTAAGRRALPASDFALGKGHYPIEDRGHARAALSMVSRYGTAHQKAVVREHVEAKYPGMVKKPG